MIWEANVYLIFSISYSLQSGGITADNFYKWFHTPKDRQSQLMPFAVELTPDSSGKYRFSQQSGPIFAGPSLRTHSPSFSDWYPIDGLLYGNDIGTHNKLFTFELKTYITYTSGLRLTFGVSGICLCLRLWSTDRMPAVC